MYAGTAIHGVFFFCSDAGCGCAAPGFFIARRYKNGLELCIFLQQHPAGRGAGDGRLLGIPGQRPERAGHEKREDLRRGAGVFRVPVRHAHDRLDMRVDDSAALQGVRAVHTLDSAHTAVLHRRQDDLRMSQKPRRRRGEARRGLRRAAGSGRGHL